MAAEHKEEGRGTRLRHARERRRHGPAGDRGVRCGRESERLRPLPTCSVACVAEGRRGGGEGTGG
eukprot:137696-Chlamydomonas_euryale.AAC.2